MRHRRLKGLSLQRWNIFVKTMETKGFFLFEVITNVLASFSVSFEYLCYGSTAVKNIFILLVLSDRFYTSESGVYRRQILTYKDGILTDRVKTLTYCYINQVTKDLSSIWNYHKYLS